MELLSVIRRWHYRDHFSIREISRRTGLSRNTVRKYLRSDTVEPKFNIPDRPSKLDPYADKLSQMLRPWRVRAAGVSAWRGVPVRLVGRLGDHRRRADQISGRSRQALLQPRLPSPRLPSADPRDAVRRPQPRLPRLGGRAAAGALRQYSH